MNPTIPPYDPEAGIDQAQLERMHEAGRKAWADVPDAGAWVDELRGSNTPDCGDCTESGCTRGPRCIWHMPARRTGCDTYCANNGCNRGKGCPGGDKSPRLDFDLQHMEPPWRLCDLVILVLLPVVLVLIFLIGPALDAWDAQDYTGDLQIAQECADRANGHEPQFTRDASGRLVCLTPKN
jgi:hypothetical protein